MAIEFKQLMFENLQKPEMNGYYPKIHLPMALTDFYTNWILNIEKLLKPEELKKPEAPKELQKFQFDFFVLFAPAVVVFLFIYAYSKELAYALMGFTAWCILYFGIYFDQKDRYIKSFKLYKQQVLLYDQQVEDYQTKFNFYLLKVDELQVNLTNVEWRESKRLEVTNLLVNPIKKPVIHFQNIKRGKSEKFFESYLNKYFPGEILTNLTTEIFNYRNYLDDFDEESYKKLKQINAYVPDFIFQHLKSNLVIDIEIDEPYSDGKPIHAFDINTDSKRNKYFTSLNWFVIRFSERQILTEPLACCFEIALLIKDYIGDSRYFNKLREAKEVDRDRVWTTKIAIEYLALNFRNSYSKLNLNPHTEKSIIGKWIYNGNVFEITEVGKILQERVITSQIVDEGNYVIGFRDCGRLLMSIKWKNTQTKYFLNSGWNNSIILTNLYSRNQYSFERSVN